MAKPIGGASGPATTTSMASADTVVIWRDATSDVRQISRTNFLSGVLTGSGTLTGGGTVATGGFTLTVPATGTASLLGTAQTYSALKTFSAGVSLGNETLSTYRTGVSWTPTGAGITFAAASGMYWRVGPLVFVTFDVTWPTTSSTTGARLQSVPVTIATVDGETSSQVGGHIVRDFNASGARLWYADSGLAALYLTDAAGVALQNAALSAKRVTGCGWYIG